MTFQVPSLPSTMECPCLRLYKFVRPKTWQVKQHPPAQVVLVARYGYNGKWIVFSQTASSLDQTSPCYRFYPCYQVSGGGTFQHIARNVFSSFRYGAALFRDAFTHLRSQSTGYNAILDASVAVVARSQYVLYHHDCVSMRQPSRGLVVVI
jgi:hypothetical protein